MYVGRLVSITPRSLFEISYVRCFMKAHVTDRCIEHDLFQIIYLETTDNED